jgi:hypothetical protein
MFKRKLQQALNNERTFVKFSLTLTLENTVFYQISDRT